MLGKKKCECVLCIQWVHGYGFKKDDTVTPNRNLRTWKSLHGSLILNTITNIWCLFCWFLLSSSRVCVKKSSQERLALKILIDRPKARNEVRGNTVMLWIIPGVCCLWLYKCALFRAPACYQSSLNLVFLSLSVCLLCFGLFVQASLSETLSFYSEQFV